MPRFPTFSLVFIDDEWPVAPNRVAKALVDFEATKNGIFLVHISCVKPRVSIGAMKHLKVLGLVYLQGSGSESFMGVI